MDDKKKIWWDEDVSYYNDNNIDYHLLEVKKNSVSYGGGWLGRIGVEIDHRGINHRTTMAVDDDGRILEPFVIDCDGECARWVRLRPGTIIIHCVGNHSNNIAMFISRITEKHITTLDESGKFTEMALFGDLFNLQMLPVGDEIGMDNGKLVAAAIAVMTLTMMIGDLSTLENAIKHSGIKSILLKANQ